jgi:hypothetical protein
LSKTPGGGVEGFGEQSPQPLITPQRLAGRAQRRAARSMEAQVTAHHAVFGTHTPRETQWDYQLRDPACAEVADYFYCLASW